MARSPLPVAAVAALVVTAAVAACAPDVVGGTRDVEDEECICDCELGCGPEGPERPDAAEAAAQATGSGGAPGGEGGAGPADGAGGSGGAGGDGSLEGCGGGEQVRVEVDGEPWATCDLDVSLGALSHVTARFDDGHTMILSFHGEEPGPDDVCVGIALRGPGNDTAENDWQVGDACAMTLEGEDGLLTGRFSATLAPVSDAGLGPRVLTDGLLAL